MPEKPEAERMANVCHARFAGMKCLGIIPGASEDPTSYQLLQAFLPQVLLQVASKGKKVIFLFTNGVSIVTSLGMTGRWIFQPLAHIRATLVFQATDGTEMRLYYDDSRRFGSHKFCTAAGHLENALSEVGRDVLHSRIPYEEVAAVCQRFPNDRVGSLLIKRQNIWGGIGNYLRAEILARCRVSPWRLMSSLTALDQQNLSNRIYEVVNESYRSNGYTIERYLSPDGQLGVFTAYVYGKQALYVNGNEQGFAFVLPEHSSYQYSFPVLGDKLPGDQQVMWWVPNWQV